MTSSLKILSDKYQILEQVGEGTYGYLLTNNFILKKIHIRRKVYKGKCLETGKFVALKKFRIKNEKEGVN
jgi:hypothetical protein